MHRWIEKENNSLGYNDMMHQWALSYWPDISKHTHAHTHAHCSCKPKNENTYITLNFKHGAFLSSIKNSLEEQSLVSKVFVVHL